MKPGKSIRNLARIAVLLPLLWGTWFAYRELGRPDMRTVRGCEQLEMRLVGKARAEVKAVLGSSHADFGHTGALFSPDEHSEDWMYFSDDYSRLRGSWFSQFFECETDAFLVYFDRDIVTHCETILRGDL